MPQPADSGDIVINEVMFDPAPVSSQYLEIYNRSNKAINLKNWSWSEVESGVLQTPHLVTEMDLMVYPDAIAVHTGLPSGILSKFPHAPVDRIWEVIDFPTLSRRDGSIALLDPHRNIIDLMYFSRDMHHALLADKQGVALQRVSPEAATLDRKNWVSAPTSTGYGTPGLRNQVNVDSSLAQELTVTPSIFDPERPPGYAGVYYKFTEPGSTISIMVYDYHGYLVRSLVSHDLAATEGVVFWDGTDHEGQKLPAGIYIVYLRQRNPQGSFNSWKSTVVISESR